MTPEEAGKLAAIMQAYADGKTIQVHQTYPSKWLDVSNPAFDFKEYDYRIKPESRTVPYTLDTFREALKHHSPALQLKSIARSLYVIAAANDDGVFYGFNITPVSYDNLLKNYTWADTGEPFGQTLTE